MTTSVALNPENGVAALNEAANYRQPPPTLYRYLSDGKYALSLLVDGLLKTSSVTSFNDPFEWLPAISKEVSREQVRVFLYDMFSRGQLPLEPKDDIIDLMLNLAPSQMGGKTLMERLREEQSRKSQMLCFAEPADSLLMWSHYSGKHTGVIIGVRALDLRRWPRSWLFPVQYAEARPVVPHLYQGFSGEHFLTAWQTKSIHWAYEREWRLILDTSELVQRGDGTWFVRLWPFAIESLVFGVRCPETTLQEAKTLIAANPQLGHVRLFRASLHDQNFEITIQPA